MSEFIQIIVLTGAAYAELQIGNSVVRIDQAGLETRIAALEYAGLDATAEKKGLDLLKKLNAGPAPEQTLSDADKAEPEDENE